MPTPIHFKDAEYQYYSRKTGLPANTHIIQMQKVYWSAQTGGSGGDTLEGLEKKWLRTLTGVTSTYKTDMWREAVVGLGLIPENSVVANKLLFYLNAP